MGRVPLCPPAPASPGPHIPAPEMLQSRGLRVWEGDLWPQYPHTLLLPRARPYSLPEQSSCRQVGSPCLWPEGTLGLLQASTWSPGCWNTPSPRLQLTCSWPGACLQKVGEHTGTVPALWHLGPCAFVFRCMSRAAGTPPPPPALHNSHRAPATPGAEQTPPSRSATRSCASGLTSQNAEHSLPQKPCPSWCWILARRTCRAVD